MITIFINVGALLHYLNQMNTFKKFQLLVEFIWKYLKKNKTDMRIIWQTAIKSSLEDLFIAMPSVQHLKFQQTSSEALQ